MGLKEVTIKKMAYVCERCLHEWFSRANNPTELPACCPKCNSPYWNKPRKVKKEK